VHKLSKPKFLNEGFTLIEMAVVLAIVGLLIGGLLVPLSVQLDLRNYNETRQKMAVIKEAIMGFAVANGRLPCPATSTVSSSSVGAGTEVCDGTTTGVVPWETLGIPELDAWNGRFSYAVTNSFIDSIISNTVSPPASCTDTPTNASFALCSAGSYSIINSDSISIGSNIPVLIISHGKNGYGAFRSDGTQVSTDDASPAELENLLTNTTFVHGTIVQSGYDDVVEWVSTNVLLNRMVTAGRLP